MPGEVADDGVWVAGQLGMRAQHLPVRGVQPRTLLGEELVVDRLANELVAKCVAGEPARFEHMVRHRHVQGLEPLGFLQRRHDGEEAVRDEASADGDDPQQLLGARR